MKQWIWESKAAAPGVRIEQGLGRACAMALAAEGVHVTLTARGAEALEKTADEIRQGQPGVTVTEVVGDITTPEGRAAALAACPDPDILINNAGGPPPGDFRNWTRDDWIKAIDANMLTPIELIKATVDGMIARKFGRIVNITSAAVKAPIDVLGPVQRRPRRPHRLRRRAVAQNRAAQRHHQRACCRARSIPTGCAASSADQSRQARHSGRRSCWRSAPSENPAGRFGDPEEFGLACAFLCGAKSGFITGQNILLDGGAFPGTL